MVELDWETMRQAVGAVVPIVAAAAGFMRGPGRGRRRLDQDVTLLEKLPDGSAPHASLLESINLRIILLHNLENSATRDWSGAVISTLMGAGLGYLTVWLFGFGTWWAYIGGVFAAVSMLACASLAFEAIRLDFRDDKGKPIRADVSKPDSGRGAAPADL